MFPIENRTYFAVKASGRLTSAPAAKTKNVPGIAVSMTAYKLFHITLAFSLFLLPSSPQIFSYAEYCIEPHQDTENNASATSAPAILEDLLEGWNIDQKTVMLETII
jgi:hypothetical protein